MEQWICQCAVPVFSTPWCRNCHKIVSIFRLRRMAIEQALREELPLKYKVNFEKLARILSHYPDVGKNLLYYRGFENVNSLKVHIERIMSRFDTKNGVE